jgi:hypothetical protein
VVWLETDFEFALCAATDEGDLGDNLKHFVVQMAGRFFEDVAEVPLINSTRYAYSAPDPQVRFSVQSGRWVSEIGQLQASFQVPC